MDLERNSIDLVCVLVYNKEYGKVSALHSGMVRRFSYDNMSCTIWYFDYASGTC